MAAEMGKAKPDHLAETIVGEWLVANAYLPIPHQLDSQIVPGTRNKSRATSKVETRIGTISLGHAIQFVANASVLGYDVRGAIVLYGLPGTPSLRKWDCVRLWAQYGGALIQP